jgi:hypothetical protein
MVKSAGSKNECARLHATRKTEAESTRAAGPLQFIARVYFKFGLERTVLC